MEPQNTQNTQMEYTVDRLVEHIVLVVLKVAKAIDELHRAQRLNDLRFHFIFGRNSASLGAPISFLQLESCAASPRMDSGATVFWSKETNVSPPRQAPL